MSQPSLLPARAWIVVLLLCAGFLVWCNAALINRANYVTSIAREESVKTADSLTGYANGTRELIIPEHIDRSYDWIAQTQQMLKNRDWRVREIDYENAPFGRLVATASPYRWWLGLVAWGDHLLSGRPLGLSVERAAILADPLLHLLFLVLTTVFVARHFGSLAASSSAVGWATMFPLAAGFLPAVPDDYVLMLGIAPWCILPLIVGLRGLQGSPEATAGNALQIRRANRWFFVAGVAGGLGVWISVDVQIPLLLGIGIGGLFAAWMMRVEDDARAYQSNFTPPWRMWALGGSVTVLLAYLLEKFPGHLGSWELRVFHPLYGVAWLGAGELLVLGTVLLSRTKMKWTASAIIRALAGLAAIAALPVAMWKLNNAGFVTVDLQSFRLTKQMDAVLAPNFLQWLIRDGGSATVWATVLPLLLIAALGWLAWGKAVTKAERAVAAIVLGPVAIAVVLAYFGLRWWQVVDSLLLVVVVVATALVSTSTPLAARRAVWLGLLATCLVAGAVQVVPAWRSAATNVLSLPEVEGLVERDLAHWLAKYSSAQASTIVLAPPSMTSALCFYGGMRGLGTFSWENKDGLSLALRVVIATSREEARALLHRREVTHIVIPSWNRFFEEYTRSAAVQTGEMFYTGLHRWVLPLWLRPIPYQLPKIAGFEQHTVMVLEVVDEQDEPVALSRVAEYFLEMGQFENAKATGQTLKRFPADFGALVARAQVEVGLRDTAAFTSVMETVLRRLGSGADRSLPWDRRVSLAVILARAQRMDLARIQVERCLAEIDEARIRSLTSFSLFHLEYLRKSFGLEVQDAQLRNLIINLAPAE